MNQNKLKTASHSNQFKISTKKKLFFSHHKSVHRPPNSFFASSTLVRRSCRRRRRQKVVALVKNVVVVDEEIGIFRLDVVVVAARSTLESMSCRVRRNDSVRTSSASAVFVFFAVFFAVSVIRRRRILRRFVDCDVRDVDVRRQKRD